MTTNDSKNTQRPLNVMFVITSMPVGGAEVLLMNLVRRFDPQRIKPSICCLKEKDELGEEVSSDIPVFEHLIKHKFDLAVIKRLGVLYKKNNIDAIVTVGAGDKMFWGRLAAKNAGIPVILSALHSTGWPDGVGRLNRLLTKITTGFIAVAESHGKFLAEFEKFPEEKVFVIPNGIDTEKFQFDVAARNNWRKQIGIPADAPTVGIVAALRAEKNHILFVSSAAQVLSSIPDAHFVIAGDGPERPAIEQHIANLGISDRVHLVGSTSDIPGVLSAVDLFALTSQNEASPVSILEAMSCGRPVVAPNVGSISESVLEGKTGFLVPEGDLAASAARWIEILENPTLGSEMGIVAREHVVANSSLNSMTEGYASLIEKLYYGARRKSQASPAASTAIGQPTKSEVPPVPTKI